MLVELSELPRNIKHNMKIMKHIALVGLMISASLQAEPIFNGKDLTGWKGVGHEVIDGKIVCTSDKKEGACNLYTEKQYENFIFDFEFKVPPAGNSGIGIHSTGDGDAAYEAMEIQVLDSSDASYKDIDPIQHHGAIYKLQAAEQGFLKPVGEWNKQTIIVSGPHMFIILNGKLINRANLDELSAKHPEHKGVKRRSGHIVICGHSDPVEFRNLNVEELPATSK